MCFPRLDDQQRTVLKEARAPDPQEEEEEEKVMPLLSVLCLIV